MGDRVYILAQLGDPWIYDPVIYQLEEGGYSIKAESTLGTSVLVGLACKQDKDPLVLAMVQESLLAPSPRCGRCYELLTFNKFKNNKGNLKIYSDLVQHMLKCIYHRLRDTLREGSSSPNSSCSVRLIVENGPSAGIYKVANTGYKAKWMLDENLGIDMYSHYYTISLLKILSVILKDLHGRAPEKLEIWIDTTYGQNYVGIAFLRATIQASRILSALLNVRVVLRQYNSEPYIKGATRELRIYKVREETISPKQAASNLIYTLIQVDPSNIDIEWNQAIAMITSPNQRILHLPYQINHHLPYLALNAAAGIFFGAPLLLLQTGRWILEAFQTSQGYDHIHGFLDLVENILSHVDSIRANTGNNRKPIPIDIEPQSNIIRLTYKIAPLKRNLTSLLAGVALARYAINAYIDIYNDKHKLPSSALANYNTICASLDELEKIKNKYIAGPVWRLVENELHNLRDAITGKKTRQDLYKRIYKLVNSNCLSSNCPCLPPGSPSNLPQKSSDNLVRIFQAHAGFPDKITGVCKLRQINKQKDEICFYYPCLINNILKEISTRLLEELYNALI